MHLTTNIPVTIYFNYPHLVTQNDMFKRPCPISSLAWCTLSPSGTLLFSGLPMIIWQKNKVFFMVGKKSCQITEIQNCILQFDRKTASVEFCQHAVLDWDFKSIWKPNPCMDPLEKKLYYIKIYSSFCRASPFHCEWPQLVTILTRFDLSFDKNFKSLKY